MLSKKNDPSLDMFLKRLIPASHAKQQAAMEAAQAILAGKPEERLLYNGREAARLLSISESSLWRLRQAKKITPVCLLGRPKYRHTDLQRLVQGDEAP